MASVRNLLNLTVKEFQAFFASFDNVLCDCDGVLYVLSKPIDGASQAINYFKSSGKVVKYISNNSTMKLDVFNARLNNIGINSVTGDIVYPTLAIIAHLKSLNFKKKVFLIGTSSMREEFEESGLKLAEGGSGRYEESIKGLVGILNDDEDVGAVVVDWDLNMGYICLQRAVVYLKSPDVVFIAGASDRQLPFNPKFNLIGPGFFQDILMEMTGRKPIAFGKPSSDINGFITAKFGIKDPRRVLFIGDSIPQDMKFAAVCNYQKLLVLSGLTKEEELDNWSHPEECKPDYYVQSLGALFKYVEQL